MAVPDFQSFFKPLLDIAADGKEHPMKEAREIIARCMNIAEENLRGTQTKFDNPIAWAKRYFVQANVFESPRRKHYEQRYGSSNVMSQPECTLGINVT